LLIVACKDDTTGADADGDVSIEVLDLLNQVEQLKLENRMKDSVLNESIAFFN
jgi:hypothetical protein